MPFLRDAILDEATLRRGAAIALYLLGVVLISYWIATKEVFLLYRCLLVSVSLVLIIGLQRQVWILILLGWSLTGSIVLLPVPASGRDLAVLVTACAYAAYRVVARAQFRQKWGPLGAVIALNAAYFAFTFYLHPVGLRILGGKTLGGRPYFTICMALMGYWVLWRLPNSIKTVSRIPLFILASMAAAVSLYALAYVFPSVPSQIPFLYAALSAEAYTAGANMGEEFARYTYLGFFGSTLLVTLIAYYPSLALLNPLRPRFYAFLMGTICVLVSGFRSIFGAVCGMFGLSVWVNRGFQNFLMTCLVGGLLLLGLGAGQGRLYELPDSTQRALSFLPGQWNPVIAAEAKQSTEGRFEMWGRIITEGIIKDWWFGDGFGASVGDWALATRKGFTETVLLMGGYHNGPLSAIHFVGIVGLVLFYVLMIMSAVYSYRCVKKCRGTLLQPVSIYLAIQLIWIPIQYTFVFGGYDSDMAQQIFLVGLLRLVMRMADTLPSSNSSIASADRMATSRPLMAASSR